MTEDEDDGPMTKEEIIKGMEATLKQLDDVLALENERRRREGLPPVTDLPISCD